MTKTLMTISFAFDIDEDSLPELVAGLEDGLRASIEDRLSAEGPDTVERFWDDFEYYGASVSLLRQRA